MVYVFAVFQILGLISSVHAILNSRTSQGAIAWAVSLNTVAVVAVPAYWVFGRSKFHGYVNAWRDASLSIDDELQSVRQPGHQDPATWSQEEPVRGWRNTQRPRVNLLLTR